MKRIKASEAKQLAVVYNEQREEVVIKAQLDEIYAKIIEHANIGNSAVRIKLKPSACAYLSTIKDTLSEDGYSVTHTLGESHKDYDEYITISWESQ